MRGAVGKPTCRHVRKPFAGSSNRLWRRTRDRARNEPLVGGHAALCPPYAGRLNQDAIDVGTDTKLSFDDARALPG